MLAPFPDWEILERVQSKREQLEQAVLAGVAMPETRHPLTAAEARAAADEIGLPVLVKPEQHVGFKQRFRRQAFRCETMEELDEAYTRAEEFEPMVQELIPGGDDALYTVGSYLDRNGRPLGVFSGRKLRQTPPGVGTCRVGEALWVQDAVDAALRLLAAFDFIGLSQVEFKRDPRDGRFKLMEINPRLWQWHGTRRGVRRRLAADRLPRPGRRDAGSGHDERGRQALGDHAACPARAPAFQRPPYVDAVFALDDPKPAAVHLARVVGARSDDPAAIERRARWVLDTIGATDVGFGDDVPYDAAPGSRSSAGSGRRATTSPRRSSIWRASRSRTGPRDEHGRFPAAASCLDPLDPPLERLRRRLGLEPPRWGGARFAVALTHDVDIALALDADRRPRRAPRG